MAKHNLIGAIRNAFLPKGGGQIFSTRFAIQQKYRAKSSLISAKILHLDKKSLRLDKNPHFCNHLWYNIPCHLAGAKSQKWHRNWGRKYRRASYHLPATLFHKKCISILPHSSHIVRWNKKRFSDKNAGYFFTYPICSADWELYRKAKRFRFPSSSFHCR